MLAVPSRVSQRLPHLLAHDLSEIDLEIRAALAELGSGDR
jgi:phage terminase Nu1 subunit (DNA packaging protein)